MKEIIIRPVVNGYLVLTEPEKHFGDTSSVAVFNHFSDLVNWLEVTLKRDEEKE